MIFHDHYQLGSSILKILIRGNLFCKIYFIFKHSIELFGYWVKIFAILWPCTQISFVTQKASMYVSVKIPKIELSVSVRKKFAS